MCSESAKAVGPFGLRAVLVLGGKGLVLLALNVALAVGALKVHESRLAYDPWETDSILLCMPEDTNFGAAILGTSHVYLLSRFERNHALTTQILGTNVMNMALYSGGGVVPNRFYLEYFFRQGNTADTVVYFLDPFVLWTPGANRDHKFIYSEPLRFGFLRVMVENGYPIRRVLAYAQSKLNHDWLRQKPELLVEHLHALTAEDIDPEKIDLRIASLYPEETDEGAFEEYCEEFLAVARLCREHGASFDVIVPPTLLGPEPGAAKMLEFLERNRAAFGEVHDLVDAMPQPEFYYNLDHLNTAGVEHFIARFVRPILAGGG